MQPQKHNTPETIEIDHPVLLSVVIPVFNEAENVADLAEEVAGAMAALGRPWELIFVDDASEDGTVEQLRTLTASRPEIRILRHGRNAGQSAAIASGFAAAAGFWVATLDGDGQNDPADLPPMLRRAREEKADCITGVRVSRRDTWFRRFSSRVANGFRNRLTGDRVSDSACGIRVVRRQALAEIPVFNGMHRFLPTLLRSQNFIVCEQPVNHRERTRGVSKYGMHNRLWRGILDCFGIRWYLARAIPGRRLTREDR